MISRRLGSFLALGLLSFGARAEAAHENNGGNLVVVQFIATARDIQAHLEEAQGTIRLLNDAELGRFAQVIDDTRVEPVSEALTDQFGQRADATVEDDDFHVGQKKIRIWEPAWRQFLAAPITKGVYILVFHEYLRVMGYNEDQQPLSNKLDMGSGHGVPTVNASGVNLSFETATPDDEEFPLAWMSVGNKAGYDTSRDTDVSATGEASGRIRSFGAQQSFGGFGQCVQADSFRGGVVRLGGYLRGSGIGGYAGLWLRVDGEFGQLIFLDNMHDRDLNGTFDWLWQSTVALVPQSATYICFGALMAGSGTAWADGLQLTRN